MEFNENSPVHSERAYWTHEVAEKLEVSVSTLRKWCIELEKNGYAFTKGEKESRAFLEYDIFILMRLKELIRVERKPFKEAILAAVEESRTPSVLNERVEQLLTPEDIRLILREEIVAERKEWERERVVERDESLILVLRELQEVKRMVAASNEKKLFWGSIAQLFQFFRRKP